jgi:hypothetical protein
LTKAPLRRPLNGRRSITKFNFIDKHLAVGSDPWPAIRRFRNAAISAKG